MEWRKEYNVFLASQVHVWLVGGGGIIVTSSIPPPPPWTENKNNRNGLSAGMITKYTFFISFLTTFHSFNPILA